MFKVVYVLSCGATGYYPEQCLMSLYTLRKHNPAIPLFVVMDSITRTVLPWKTIDAISQFAEVLTFETPDEYNTEKLRSRFLKTSIRRLVSGDFLFVDCDTIVCRTFNDHDFRGLTIGMVADLNASLPLLEENTLTKCYNAGFRELKGAPYYNSGVFFVKDTPESYAFFDTWHKLWRESTQRGCSYDQPALCEANRQFGFPIQEISGKWNCQIKFSGSMRFLRDAVVLHYFAADGSARRPFHEEELLRRVRDNGIDSTVEAVLNSSVDALAAFFSQKSDNVLRFLGTDMFSVFIEDRPTFRFAERIARRIQRMKRRMH